MPDDAIYKLTSSDPNIPNNDKVISGIGEKIKIVDKILKTIRQEREKTENIVKSIETTIDKTDDVNIETGDIILRSNDLKKEKNTNESAIETVNAFTENVQEQIKSDHEKTNENYDNLNKILKNTNTCGLSIKKVFNTITDMIGGISSFLKNKIVSINEVIFPIITKFFTSIFSMFKNNIITRSIVNITMGFINIISSSIKFIYNIIKIPVNVLMSAWNILKDTISLTYKGVKFLTMFGLDLIATAGKYVLRGVTWIASTFIKTAIRFIGNPLMWPFLIGFGYLAYEAIINVVGLTLKMPKFFVDIIKTVGNVSFELLEFLWSGVTYLFGFVKLPNNISTIFDTIITHLNSGISWVFNLLFGEENTKQIFSNISGFINSITEPVKTGFNKTMEFIEKTIEFLFGKDGIISNPVKMIGEYIDKFVNFLDEIGNQMIQQFSSVGDIISGIFAGIQLSISDVTKSAIRGITGFSSPETTYNIYDNSLTMVALDEVQRLVEQQSFGRMSGKLNVQNNTVYSLNTPLNESLLRTDGVRLNHNINYISQGESFESSLNFLSYIVDMRRKMETVSDEQKKLEILQEILGRLGINVDYTQAMGIQPQELNALIRERVRSTMNNSTFSSTLPEENRIVNVNFGVIRDSSTNERIDSSQEFLDMINREFSNTSESTIPKFETGGVLNNNNKNIIGIENVDLEFVKNQIKEIPNWENILETIEDDEKESVLNTIIVENNTSISESWEIYTLEGLSKGIIGV